MNFQEWDNFVQAQAPDGGLLQSSQWARFQKSLKRLTFKIEIKDEGGARQILALVLKFDLPLAQNFLYVPRGPVVKQELLTQPERLTKFFNHFLAELQEIAFREKAVFVRLDPAWPPEQAACLQELGFQKSPQAVQPQSTLILDLDLAETKLLQNMKPKTRYNIRLSAKKNIQIKIDNSQFKVFWSLLQETSQRDKFRPHPQEYYQKMLAQEGLVKLFLAEHQGRFIAANLVAFHQDWAYYLHGASSYTQRQLMAPYFLHWQTILEAKKQGCHYYDLWGINVDKERQSWAGISHFKRGFAPQVPITHYLGTYEIVFRPWPYRSYLLFRNLQKKLF